MILLRGHNLLFLKPRKVGGTSFEIALSKYAGSEDILTKLFPADETLRRELGYRSAQNHSFTKADGLADPTLVHAAKKDRKFFSHIPAALAKNRLGDVTWESALKVSIIRNPFDKLVSEFCWTHREKKNFSREKFEKWMRNHPLALNKNDEQYLIRGEDIIDYYIRYEHLEADILQLEKLKPSLKGLYEAFSNLSAKAGVRPPSVSPAELFAEQPGLVEAVRFFNKSAIGRFGYELCE